MDETDRQRELWGPGLPALVSRVALGKRGEGNSER